MDAEYILSFEFYHGRVRALDLKATFPYKFTMY